MNPKVVAESFRGMCSHQMNKKQLALANRLVADGYGLWLHGHIFATI